MPCTRLPYRPRHNCQSAANRSPVLLIPQKIFISYFTKLQRGCVKNKKEIEAVLNKKSVFILTYSIPPLEFYKIKNITRYLPIENLFIRVIIRIVKRKTITNKNPNSLLSLD